MSAPRRAIIWSILVTTFEVASAATVGPHLYTDAEGPKIFRGLHRPSGTPEALVAPFVGAGIPLVRVHRDNDARKPSDDDAAGEALVSKLKEKLPKDTFEVVANAATPVSVVLQFEQLRTEEWPEEIRDLAGPFGRATPKADEEGGVLVHAYLSSSQRAIAVTPP